MSAPSMQFILVLTRSICAFHNFSSCVRGAYMLFAGLAHAGEEHMSFAVLAHASQKPGFGL